MKKIIFVLSAALVTVFYGCLDVLQETTVKQDGSGVFTTQIDMSAMLEMLAQMGGLGEEKIEADSSLKMSSLLDSAQGLTPEEKGLLKDATVHIRVNSTTNEFLIALNTPFSKTDDIEKIKAALGKADVAGKAINGVMEKEEGEEKDDVKFMMGNGDGNFKLVAVDDYFTTTASKGLFKRILIKEKYDSLSTDVFMQKMKEGLEQGMPPMKFVFILNLPSPAKNADGKNVVLSEDKKKITIENTLDELFDDPASFEFTIEY